MSGVMNAPSSNMAALVAGIYLTYRQIRERRYGRIQRSCCLQLSFNLTFTIMAKKENKFIYGWNIWTNYGYGWEIECSYYKHESTYKDVLHDAKEYRSTGLQVHR